MQFPSKNNFFFFCRLLDAEMDQPKRKYVCRECLSEGREFSTDEKARLDGHYLGAHRIFKIKCKQCDYSHQHPNVLRRHVQSVHEKIRQKCNLCELTYATKAGVSRHVRNVHSLTPTENENIATSDSSTDENDGDSDDSNEDENNNDENSDIGESAETSSDEEDQMETGTPVPNAGVIDTTMWIHDDGSNESSTSDENEKYVGKIDWSKLDELMELSYLEPEVILEELEGEVCLNYSPEKLKQKHHCNQACDFSTDTREKLDAHLCIKHMVFRTKCEHCEYSSEYPSVLRDHVQSVHEKIRHKCNFCELTYATKTGVRRHVKNAHEN